MTVPKRKGSAPAEATQQLQSLDVLELVEALKPKGDVAAPRKSVTSSSSINSSIAPVGLDLRTGRAGADEEVNATMQVRLPVRQRRLKGIVIGAIAGCALILVAAGIARVGHASSSPESTSTATPVTTAAAPAAAPQNPTPAPATAAPATTGNASTGTVRLDRPARPGYVWLDGKKLSSSSALVSCGTHQIKVGLRRTHSVDVPCGSEIGVSK